MTAIAPDRQALRTTLRERRRAVPVRERLDAAASLAANLLPELAAHEGFVSGYWAVGGELPLHAVQSALPATLRWCLPVLHDDGRLRFREWRAGQALEANRHGIPEPVIGPLLDAEALTVVLVPLLAFDARGNRLGQGGGWYDRSFAFRRASSETARDHAPPIPSPAPQLIGIGYDWQQVEALDAANWDVPLDAVATPSAFRHFDPAR
mgnify:CR=1 FL=1